MLHKLLSLTMVSAMVMSASPVHAADATVTTAKTQMQVPCKVYGMTDFAACAVKDIYFQAPAPMNDVYIDKAIASPLIGKYQTIAVVHRYHIVPKWINLDGAVNVYTKGFDFVAQYDVRNHLDVVIVYTSSDKGRSWSAMKSLTKGVSNRPGF